MAKSKKVAIYIEYKYISDVIPIICEFDSAGSIFVKVEFKFIYDIPIINQILFEAINPIINIVKGFLEDSGYKIVNFSQLNQSNIEIINLIYSSTIQLTNLFKLNN